MCKTTLLYTYFVVYKVGLTGAGGGRGEIKKRLKLGGGVL